MKTIERSLVVQRPLEQVWDTWTDVRILPDLSRSTVEVRDAPDRLTEVGQTFCQVVQAAGRRVETTWTVVDVVARDRLVIESRPVKGVHVRLAEEVEAVAEDRTRTTIRIDYSLPFGPLGAVVGKLGVERLANEEAGAVLEALCRRLEADATARSADERAPA